MEHIIEEWRPVVGWEGKYEISSEGRLKNLSSGIISSGYKTKCGYSYASLYDRDLKKEFSRTIHRLVAHAFIPNPNNLPYVNHKDENKLNNKADNLEWCSYSYNTKYNNSMYVRLNTRNKNQSRGCEKKVYQYDLQGNLIKIWNSVKAICRELNYKTSNISSCCLNKKYRKTAYGYKWSYTCL